MNRKRILTLAVASALAVSALSGCGSDKKNENDVKTVSVWTNDGGSKLFYEREIDEWNKTEGKKKGVYIDYTVQEGSLDEKLDLAFSSGKAPDMFSGGNMQQMVANNQILTISELPGGDEMIEKFKSGLDIGGSVIDGKVYTLSRTVTTYGLLYNKEMFVEAGIVDENGEAKPPETLDEMVEVAAKLTNKSKKQYGIIYPAKWSSFFDVYVTKPATATDGFPLGYNPAEGKYDLTAEADVMKAIMQMKNNGSSFPGADGIDNDQARARFGLGGIGMIMGASYDYGVLTQQFPAKIEWGVAPFPSKDANNKHLQFMTTGGDLIINRESLDKIGADKLMTAFSFFYSDKFLTDAYKEGISIPLNMETVKDVELKEEMQNWKAFMELIGCSRRFVRPRNADTTGEKSFGNVCMNEIWTGKMPLDNIYKLAQEKTDMMNRGIEKFAKDHPEYDGSIYIIKDWNTAR